MSKWVKRLLGIAAIGSAAAGLFYFLKKYDYDVEEEFDDDFEDEDFDLDNDLKPASDREYVSLNAQTKAEEPEVNEVVEETTEKVADEEKEAVTEKPAEEA